MTYRTIRDEIAAIPADGSMPGWHFTACTADVGWIPHTPSIAQDALRYSSEWADCRLRSPNGNTLTCPEFADLYRAIHTPPKTPAMPTPTTFTLTPSTPPAPDHSTFTCCDFWNADQGIPIFERDGRRYLMTFDCDDLFIFTPKPGDSFTSSGNKRPIADLGFTYVGNLVL